MYWFPPISAGLKSSIFSGEDVFSRFEEVITVPEASTNHSDDSR